MAVADKIGKKGRIKTGKYAGYFFRIEDDSKNTGGFLILTWTDALSRGFDNWVENVADLEQFLGESGFDIEWLE